MDAEPFVIAACMVNKEKTVKRTKPLIEICRPPTIDARNSGMNNRRADP
jgi:hypothetical protein